MIEPDLASDARRLRAVVSGATLIMVVLSAPLWLDRYELPLVPFVAGWPSPRGAWSVVALLILVVGLVVGTTARFGRLGAGLAAALLIWLIVGDQLRFQPWVYQFVLIGGPLAIRSPGLALRLARLDVAALFFHSGLSKLDASFATEIGPSFARAFAGLVGLDPDWIVGPGRGPIVLAMPAVEIVVAILLLIPTTRRIGLMGAVSIHLALVAILGPWALGQSTIVLVWNVAMAIEECILFGPRPRPGPALGDLGPADWFAVGPVVVAAVVPFGERLGWIDSWPGHALYASHAERSTIRIEDGRLDGLPTSLRGVAERPDDSEARTIRPTAWTLAVCGVPAYPQCRYANGLAESIASRAIGRGRSVRVIHGSRADPITRARESHSVIGLDEIRRLGESYRLNAHPRLDRRP